MYKLCILILFKLKKIHELKNIMLHVLDYACFYWYSKVRLGLSDYKSSKGKITQLGLNLIN